MKKPLRLILALLLCLATITWSADADPEESPATISGRVTDTAGVPLAGASVVLSYGDTVITGTSTDIAGHYGITTTNRTELTLRVSSIGYRDTTVVMDSVLDPTATDIVLRNRNHEIEGIEVSSPRQIDAEVTVGKEAVRSSSRRALVPTNPIVSLRQPQIARVGSSHSSQIRVNGTSPDYSLNGISIGRDPDHYGMFPVIPGTVVDAIRFYPEGTPVTYRLPAIIDLETSNRFTPHHGGELNLSTIEATGTYSLGTERFFALGSVRKSVLDRLVNQFDVSSDRRTLPPTNFRDIFFSSGVKVNPHLSLATDQYYVRDFLSYNTGGISGDDRNEYTYQHTEESFISTRFQALYPGVLLNASLATRNSLKEYRANPDDASRGDLVQLNLTENKREYLADLDAQLDIGKWDLTVGSQAEYLSHRDVSLSQRNWNFLPPFSNSDRPFIYQQALNDEYATFSEDVSEFNGAAYVSAGRSIGRFDLRVGIRNDYFRSLAKRDALSLRGNLGIDLSTVGRINLFFGTFAENPANNILEPYQVLVRDWLSELNPIRHRIVRAGYSRGPLSFGLFQKSTTNMPVITPDFRSTDASAGEIGPDFIRMTSTGRASFYGGTVSFDSKHLLQTPISIYTSYAYTRAYRVDNGVTIPYELNAPHRFMLELDARPSPRWSLGAQLNIRSGYPYTPYTFGSIQTGRDMYTPDYYHAAVQQENSDTFPITASLNLSGACTVGDIQLFFSVSNVTNRGNPIINSASGYIYDAGILPSVGMRWQF